MKPLGLGCAVACLWATWAPLAAADIFIAYDEDGSAVFTDRPPHAGAIPFIRAPGVPGTGGMGRLSSQEPGAQLASIGVRADTQSSTSEPKTILHVPEEGQRTHNNKSFRNAD